jgi:hypothetical protein
MVSLEEENVLLKQKMTQEYELTVAAPKLSI